METPDYLKHLTVIVIGTFAGLAFLIRPDLAMPSGMILTGILGYVFKNGHQAAKSRQESTLAPEVLTRSR